MDAFTVVVTSPIGHQATHHASGLARLNLTGLREKGLVVPPTPSQVLAVTRQASPNGECRQQIPRSQLEKSVDTPARHLQQAKTTTRKARSGAWY